MGLIAYHNDAAIKQKYLTRVRKHREADNLIRGTGWDGHRGCAVGCTLEKYEHAAYETELGIPRALARLEDALFESMPIELAMAWPERFLAAITPGADLTMVIPTFLHWLLVDPTEGIIHLAKSDRSKASIQRVADLLERKIAGEEITTKEWRNAAADADAAYAAAADAAADAADAAAAAADAAADAADAAAADAADADAAYAAAADAAAAAADADADAAYAAAAAAYAADAAYAYADADAAAYAYAAARSLTRTRQADKLIELLEAAK